jgi:carboxylesterase type B
LWIHQISPGSWPYFSKAIPMSAPLGIPLLSTTNAQTLGDLVAKNVGCPTGGSDLAVECLRNISAEVMLVNGSGTNYPVSGKTGVEMFMRWTAVVDGETVPLEIATAFVTNRWSHKPMMPTTVANESVEFVQGFGKVKPNDLGVLLSIFMRNITIGLGAVEHYWPGGVPQVPDALPLLEPLVTDYLFQCPAKYFGQQAAKQNPNVPIYEYYFSLSYASWLNWTYGVKGNMPECIGVSCHADDLPLIFWPWKIAQAKNDAPPTPPTQEENYLHLQMQTAWANFARTSNPNDPTGNPLLKNEKLKHLAKPMLGAFRRVGSSSTSRYNNASFPFFPRFDERDIKMNFSIPATLIQNYRTYYCDFWDVYTKNAEGIPYRIS